MEHLNNKGNYDEVLNYAIRAFAKYDPIKMAKNSNSTYNESDKLFTIDCMDMKLYVKYPSGEIFYEDNSRVSKTALEILIIRFLSNANISPETKKYITFKEVEGGYVYYPAFFKTSINRLVKTFGCNIEKFEEVMQQIGATKISMGDSAYKIRFINDTYVVYVIWEGDDEFEPYGNILFDANIKYYFNAEDIAVVGDMPFIRINEELDKIIK